MMLKTALTKSGIRILKAIKKLSTKSYVSGKKRKSSQTSTSAISKIPAGTSTWRSSGTDHEAVSLSWSLMSLDTKSVDTYLTIMSENLLENSDECSNEEKSCCCCCPEYEENQRNENRENEMFA